MQKKAVAIILSPLFLAITDSQCGEAARSLKIQIIK